MKLFFALTSPEFLHNTLSTLPSIPEPRPSCVDFLISFAMFRLMSMDNRGRVPFVVEAKSYDQILNHYGFGGGTLILDSGAYSALTLGTHIKLHDYNGWIRKQEAHTQSCVEFYSALDVIGNPDLTWRNLKVAELDGLRPRPVVHWGCSDDQIKRVVDNYREFSVGGLVPLLRSGKGNRDKIHSFLDRVFTLASKWGSPIVHGFGLSVPSLLLRYPFSSVDSSSWLAGPRYARVALWSDRLARFVSYSPNDSRELKLCPGVAESYGLGISGINEVFKGDRVMLRCRISAMGLTSYWRMSQYVNRVWKSKGGVS